MKTLRLALLLSVATLPALAQAPPKPPTPLEKAIADLNQSYSGLNGNINALGITANDIRDHQIATVQAAIGTVLAAKTQEDADKLAALKAQDDAALATAKKANDAKVAALTKQAADQRTALNAQYTSTHGALLEMANQHKADTDKLVALQRRVDDQARQLLHAAPAEPPMCINGPMSPKQYQQSKPAPGHK